MPPALLSDWSQVKATAIATGSLKEAADAHQISYEAVRMRASREQWPVGQRVVKIAREAQEQAEQAVALARGGNVTPVTKAADAVAFALADRQKRTKLGLAGYTARMAKQAHQTGTIEQAPLYKAVADIAGKVWPEQAQDVGVSLSFFSVSISTQQREEKPVLDIEQA